MWITLFRRQSAEAQLLKLEVQDLELIEHAKKTRRTLYRPGRHEVASALRTHSGEVFTGIHIEANVGFADVCGEVAAICHAVAHGHGDLDTIVALGGDGPDHIYLMPPCGRCREVISDMNSAAWVIVGGALQNSGLPTIQPHGPASFR